MLAQQKIHDANYLHMYTRSYSHNTPIIFIVAFIISTSNSNDKWLSRWKTEANVIVWINHMPANERIVKRKGRRKVHWHIQQDTITTNATNAKNSTPHRAYDVAITRTLECTSNWPEYCNWNYGLVFSLLLLEIYLNDNVIVMTILWSRINWLWCKHLIFPHFKSM